MKKTILILLIFLTFGSLSAKNQFYHHQLGASASMFSGAGLSYKYILNNFWAFKATGFIYYYTNKDNGDMMSKADLWGSIGGEVQYYLHHSKHTGLYVFVGFAEWYEENNHNEKTYDRRFNIGPGFGLDLIIWENIVINLDMGFIYAIENNDFPNDYYYYSKNPESFTYAGGIGIGYRF